MIRFYFDTSAINELYDDPRCSDLKNEILKLGFVYPSVFTIAEVASEIEKERRTGLLKIIYEISGRYRPLAMPGDLLKRSIKSVDAWAKDMDHSMGPEWEGVWIAMSDPSQIDERAYREIIDWKKSQEEWFQNMHVRGRPRVQEVIRKFPKAEFGELTSSFSNMVRYYPPDREFVINSVIELASNSGTNIKVDTDLARRLVQHSEHWRFFLTGMLYGMYARSFKLTHYGKRINPGSIDTQQAIYLATCDTFVTSDQEQRRMLRLLVPFGHKIRSVMEYSKFSDRLISYKRNS
jgi:hypothetical protein